MPPKPKALLAVDDVRPWLADQLARPISDRDLYQFRGLVGTLRTSREVLVRVTDGNLLHTAWLWEKQHEARDSILFQLKARMNAKGIRKPALRSVASKPEPASVPEPAPIQVSSELAEAQKALRDLADALPSFVAFGARVSFSFSLGEAITAEERRARRQG